MGTESGERRMPPYTRTIGGCFVGATLAVARTAAADVDLGDRKGRPYISLRAQKEDAFACADKTVI